MEELGDQCKVDFAMDYYCSDPVGPFVSRKVVLQKERYAKEKSAEV